MAHHHPPPICIQALERLTRQVWARKVVVEQLIDSRFQPNVIVVAAEPKQPAALLERDLHVLVANCNLLADQQSRLRAGLIKCAEKRNGLAARVWFAPSWL